MSQIYKLHGEATVATKLHMTAITIPNGCILWQYFCILLPYLPE